jgi:AraC-like DNA-binding protein
MIKTFPAHRSIFLWKNRTLCLGPSSSLLPRVYGSVAMHIGLYRPFKIRIKGYPFVNCRCVIVPPNMIHEVDFEGSIDGKMFIERDSDDFLYLHQRFPFMENQLTFFDDPETIECFQWIYEENACKSEIKAALDTLLEYGKHSLSLSIDPRIQKVINLTKSEPDRNFTQEYLASVADLSVSRFLHLFKENIGVPYRRFRIWKRLADATSYMNQTDNMSRSALDAGFSDVAHFSHRYKETYGVNPALVFRHVTRFEVSH